MTFTEGVKECLPKQGRPRLGEERGETTRFSLTIPVDKNKMLERVAAVMETNRHALAAALAVYGLELLIAELQEKGELPDALRMVR